MKSGIVSLAFAAMAVATPALAEPVVIAGAAPRQPATAPSDCVVEPTGAASARIRCRVGGSAQGPASELTFLVSAQSASSQSRCAGAEVVRLSAAPRRAAPTRSLVVEGTPTAPCGA